MYREKNFECPDMLIIEFSKFNDIHIMVIHKRGYLYKIKF